MTAVDVSVLMSRRHLTQLIKIVGLPGWLRARLVALSLGWPPKELQLAASKYLQVAVFLANLRHIVEWKFPDKDN